MNARLILILGGTSVIGRHIALEICRPDDRVLLAARNREDLEHAAGDLRVRVGCEVSTIGFEACEFHNHSAWAENVLQVLGVPDIVLVATGALGDQIAARSDTRAMVEIVASNYLGVATALAGIVSAMESRGSGHVLVLSSVAGDRGRASNYIYGSAKAGMNAWLSGLRNRLHASGVRVSTLKLGFVDTRMVAGKSGMFLVAKPKRVAEKVRRIVERPRDVAYIPAFWFVVMTIICAIPESIFKKLKL